jgi:hypothetical protein
MPVIPTFGRQEEDCKFEANLGYMARPCLKANKKEFTSFVLEDFYYFVQTQECN